MSSHRSPLQLNCCSLIWRVSQMQTQPGSGRAQGSRILQSAIKELVLQLQLAVNKSVCELTCESGSGANWSGAFT